MTGSIGLGLILNVLFWTAAVLVVVGLAALAVIEWFPGREPGVRDAPPASRGADNVVRPRDGATASEDETADRYRNAS